jgi:ADP-ribose pyrophosphatase YjhB (NUDIX family)
MFFSQVKTLTLKSCPLCAQTLQVTSINGRDRLVCFTCEFVHWDNPVPVTATIVPYISAASPSAPASQQTNSRSEDKALVLVRRKYPPFVNDWCLPGGFVEAHEAPEISATREVAEETGLNIDVGRIIGAYAPGKGINVIIIFYLAMPTSGILTPGDDASEVGIFKQNNLPENIAFPLHKEMIDKWFVGQL